MSDEQPAKVEMRSPDGAAHMVLARDQARFEEQGWEYAGPFGTRASKAPAPRPGRTGKPSTT